MLSQVSVFSLVLAGLVGLIIGLLICRIIVGKTGKQNTTLPKELLQEGYNEGARLWLSSDKKQLVTEMDGAFFREYGELNAVQQAKAENLLLLWKDWVGTEPAAAANSLEAGDWQPAFEKQPMEAGVDSMPLPEGLSVTQQINAILQEMLADSEFADKEILLEDNEASGLDIWINDEKFSGLENVPSESLTGFILDAVRSWKKRAGN